jgi:hypothetical protein
VEEIITKNKDIKQYLKQNKITDIESNIALKYQFRRRDKEGNEAKTRGKTVVLELSPDIRRIVVNNKSLFIGFQSCRASDYLQIIRCFKCNAFGHIAANCSADQNSCGHCGSGHDSKSCDKSKPNFCVNCDKHNKSNKSQRQLKTNHSVFDEKELGTLGRIPLGRMDTWSKGPLDRMDTWLKWPLGRNTHF